jgi:hypothetical protein
MFKRKAVLKGVCYSPYTFEMRIERRTGENISGTVVWDSLETETRFKGTIKSDGSIQFQELEV